MSLAINRRLRGRLKAYEANEMIQKLERAKCKNQCVEAKCVSTIVIRNFILKPL